MFGLVLLLCALFATSLGHSLAKRDDGAEALIDEFIYEMTKEMKDKHQEEVPIPNIDETFERKWKFIKLRGEFTAKGGWFKDVTTLKRTGPLEMTQGDNSITIGISLGLEDMEFGFKEYSAEIFHIGVHGRMSVSIASNEVYIHLTMTFDGKSGCKTNVDKIEVTKLDDFHVDMTGLGRDADFIYSYVVQLMANKYHEKIAKAITDKLVPTVNAALARNDICKKFPM